VSWIADNELPLRLGIFTSVLLLMALWEFGAPRRELRQGRRSRWPANFGMAGLNVLLARLLLPGAAVGAAAFGASSGWGLFQTVAWPGALEVLLSIVALDLVIYLQHVAFHAVPGLWRIHRVHHSDIDFDTTTAVRFHPFEILLSLAIKVAAILLLGAPVVAVFLFEALLSSTSLFNHGNVRLPLGVDRLLRLVLVTPDMHRVHHSVDPVETNSNYGFNLPWWDRLFGTYRDQPQEGHEQMGIGVEQLLDAQPRNAFLWMLALPLRPATPLPD
jgi:sterol desaturase/sphingolipid hydroxylase (fatty acid hydroxylase superfamily)